MSSRETEHAQRRERMGRWRESRTVPKQLRIPALADETIDELSQLRVNLLKRADSLCCYRGTETQGARLHADLKFIDQVLRSNGALV